MRPTTPRLADTLTGSFPRRFVGRLFVGRREVMPNVDLDLVDVSLGWDASAQVMGSGKASILYRDDWGRSLAPRELDSWLSPFNSWLHVAMLIGSERIELGRFAISSPEETERGRARLGRTVYTTGQRIDVTLRDAFSITDRERIVSLAQIPAGTSAIAALEDLLGLPVLTGAADAPVTAAVTLQESRLDAAYDIAQYLGGVPYVRPDGAVGIRPTASPPKVLDLREGADGTVSNVKVDAWDTEQVYNQVVIRGTGDASETVLADVRVEQGRLKWGPMSAGCWGRVPYFYSSDYITTERAAETYALGLLARVSKSRAMGATVTAVPDPRLEVGDVVTIPIDGTQRAGRIVKLTLTGEKTEAVVSIG